MANIFGDNAGDDVWSGVFDQVWFNILIHRHGRVGIGVAQPQSGYDYPLISPSPDVRHLLADFYIAFDQPSDYGDAPPFDLPFRIKWLYGFGYLPQGPDPEDSLSADGQPVPAHNHDIIIVDKHDVVVFDSTQDSVTYTTRAWTPWLRIVSWRHSTDQVVNVVYHTAWAPHDSVEPQHYPGYFFPENAVLDERTIERLPKRVRSLRVVLDNLRGGPVNLAAGYNMRLAVESPETVAGGRFATRIVFNAVPGAGLGIFPDCISEPLAVRKFNGAMATDDGNFFMTAQGCYWVRQPTRVINTDPRTVVPEVNMVPGSIPTPGLPSPDAGTSKNAPGWPLNDSPTYAHLQFGNDCGPCCDCDDYVSVARYMNRTRDRYVSLGGVIEEIRDEYHGNRERWLNSLDCRQQHPLRIRMLAQRCPVMDVALQFCNQTSECLRDVELIATFETSPDGGDAIEVPGYTFITAAQSTAGRTSPATDRYQMDGEWPEFKAFFDSIHPGQSVSVRFRMEFANCGMSGAAAYAITGCLSATIDGVEVQAEACETRTLNCPMQEGVFSRLPAAGPGCPCE